VQRRVSCRGALVVAEQRIHVGIVHAGQTLTVEAADSTWRIYNDEGLVAEVARTTTKPVARFKVHKPEPPRRPAATPSDRARLYDSGILKSGPPSATTNGACPGPTTSTTRSANTNAVPLVAWRPDLEG
jgi:hypothetical protein